MNTREYDSVWGPSHGEALNKNGEFSAQDLGTYLSSSRCLSNPVIIEMLRFAPLFGRLPFGLILHGSFFGIRRSAYYAEGDKVTEPRLMRFMDSCPWVVLAAEVERAGVALFLHSGHRS